MRRYRRPRFEALEDRQMLSVLAGNVYSDLNSSGAKDAGEPGLAGWTAYLDQSGDGLLGDVANTKTASPNGTCQDNATTRFYQTVTDSVGNVTDLNLRFTLANMRADSVNLSLTSPTGQTVALVANLTDTGYSFSATTLDDEAVAAVSSAVAPYAGTFTPSNPLSAFDGHSANGTWTLTVNSDLIGGGDGTLVDWNLIISTPEQRAVTDANGDWYLEVAAGSYTVRVVPQANWSQTSPTAPPYYLRTIGTGAQISGLAFGEHYTQPTQIVGTVGPARTAWFGRTVGVPLDYSVSDGDATLSGLGLRIHYDSTKLQFSAVTGLAANHTDTTGPVADTANYDGDASTDKFVVVSFVDTSGNWPGAFGSIGTATFSVRSALIGQETAVRFTASSLAAGYGFTGHAATLNGASSSIDADGNGTCDALTDGILILRYLFSPDGDFTVAGATGVGATRTTREDIRTWLQTAPLDVDGNGTADALTDGILALRFMFTPAGNFQVADAIGAGATRTSLAEIRAFLYDALP
jgi:subtilisin-like proprotein convertase family protein